MLAAVIELVVLPTPELIINTPIRVVLPIAPLKVIDPVPAERVKLLAPSIVLETKMLPPPEFELSDEDPVKVMALPRETFALPLVIDPFKWTVPLPL